MPYRTRWHAKGVVWTFFGDVTAAEIEAANDEFYRNPRCERARFQIIDARAVTSVEWSERDIKRTAGYDLGAENLIKDVRVAWVTSDEHIAGLIEKYTDLSRSMNSSWQFCGFDDPDAARAWAEAER